MSGLYRGYVRTRGKECLEPFKGRADLRTLEEARELEEYAGVLAEDAVLIDVDDRESADAMMRAVEATGLRCRVVRTERGRHFVMRDGGRVKRCATGTALACGIRADVKVGSRNSYEFLKRAGVEREVERDSEAYDDIPAWMLPVGGKANFSAMGAGEGRNSALYRHILTLTGAGLSKEESREALRIANAYVLRQPLEEDELELVMRDDAFPEEAFFDGKAFRHDRFAEFLANDCRIRRIDGQLHVWADGAYVGGYRNIEAAMYRRIPTLKAAQRAEVLKCLEIIRPDDEPPAEADLVAFANGNFRLSTGELLPHDPEVAMTNLIPWAYDPQAYSELADRTLDRMACGDAEVRALMEECLGYCFYRRNELSKAFILTGDKSNGKSTFLDMAKNLLGERNYSALDLAELDERFSVATMAGKLANIGDDISDEFLSGRSVATFKKVVSGNRVKAEHKGQDAFFFSPYVKLLFSANEVPRIRDKTGAVMRRLVIVPFNARFSKDDPDFDPYITHKLRSGDAMRYLARIGVEALRRVLRERRFTEPASVTEELRAYELQNSPVLMFAEETDRATIVNNATADVYRAYRVFCAENGFSEMTRASFTKELCGRLGLGTANARVDGRVVKVFRANVENSDS